MMVAENDDVFFKQNPSKVPVFFCQHLVSQPQHRNTFHIQRFGVSPGNVQVQVVESQLRDAGGSLVEEAWRLGS